MKNYFIVAVAVVGITEWLKNFLPNKVKDNNKIMAGIALVLSIAGSLGFLYANKIVNNIMFTWQSASIFCISVIGLTQTCYTVLLQTAKAVKRKLTEKASIDPETLADEIVDQMSKGKQ